MVKSFSSLDYVPSYSGNNYKTTEAAIVKPTEVIIKAITAIPEIRPSELPDPCEENNGECQHICMNIDGKAVCRCRINYLPLAGGKICIRKL